MWRGTQYLWAPQFSSAKNSPFTAARELSQEVDVSLPPFYGTFLVDHGSRGKFPTPLCGLGNPHSINVVVGSQFTHTLPGDQKKFGKGETGEKVFPRFPKPFSQENRGNCETLGLPEPNLGAKSASAKNWAKSKNQPPKRPKKGLCGKRKGPWISNPKLKKKPVKETPKGGFARPESPQEPKGQVKAIPKRSKILNPPSKVKVKWKPELDGGPNLGFPPEPLFQLDPQKKA